MKVVFVRPNKDAWGYKPIGLSLLIALEKRKGNEVFLFDTTRYNFDVLDNNTAGVKSGIFKPVDMSSYHQKVKPTAEKDFYDLLSIVKPDEVKFSVMSDQTDLAETLSNIAREFTSNIIWGGSHPTMSGDCPEFIHKHKGEAIQSLYNVKCLDDLPYLSWDEYEEGNFWRPFNGKAYRAGDHMLNWGCSNHCSYCINSMQKVKVRRYGVERIIDELVFLKERHNINFFKFHDEDFLLRPTKNIAELAQSYSDRVGLPFVCETNPMNVTEEKAQIMKNMGCVSVSMGVETGNEHLRSKVLNRRDSIDDVVRAFKIFNKVGVRGSSFNMLGIPFETWDTYQDTIELNKRAEVVAPYADFFYPFQGTILREVAIKEGFFNPLTDGNYTRGKSQLTFPTLSPDDLLTMKSEFTERIHA